MYMNLKPMFNRVIVKAIREEVKGGIILPETAGKEKPERGIIVAVGEGKRNEKGDLLSMRYKVGDKIMFSKYGYDEITINEEEYYVISESNILGIFR